MANDEAAFPAAQPPLAGDAAQEARASGLVPQLRYLLRTMRPRQWTKNGIVFLALIFSVGQEYHINEPSTWLPMLLAALAAFACFSLVSSADYLVNDIRDVESDRAHPRKRHRPIAAGLLAPNVAWSAAAVLFVAGNAGAFLIDWRAGMVVLAYTVLMIGYSYALKHVVLIDLMVIAAGFVLRAMAGA
jgi:4-hydroxybenzoate polyprenyltransferase